MPSRPRIALVLSGGAARGAYEAGVIAYLRDGLPRDTGVHARFDVLCGSSVGAINACFLAATAHRPEDQARQIVEQWTSVRFERVMQLGTGDVMQFMRSLVGGRPRPEVAHRQGGIIDPRVWEHLVLDICPWSFIPRNVQDGHLEALAVSATHVASGHTVVFVQRRAGGVPSWSHDPFVHALPAQIRPQHALASAAIPVLFPAVAIDGQFYCDGGLRQNTPLSPALRLGAERVLVVSLRHVPTPEERAERLSFLPSGEPEPVPSPYFLFGKVINALWLDHVDYDLDRLRRTNSVLEAGARAFGPDFAARLNTALAEIDAPPLRRIDELRVQPSRDIGAIALDFARDEGLHKRAKGLAGTLLRRMASAESRGEMDLLSYLLFDGDYCRALIELGRDDARAMRDQLAAFFSDAP